eukprot:6345094-Prymnesium_polylepis.1
MMLSPAVAKRSVELLLTKVNHQFRFPTTMPNWLRSTSVVACKCTAIPGRYLCPCAQFAGFVAAMRPRITRSGALGGEGGELGGTGGAGGQNPYGQGVSHVVTRSIPVPAVQSGPPNIQSFMLKAPSASVAR